LHSSDTTKYIIHLTLTAEGVVDKPDVVGAIFGQTEGLLGEELDLRDLQRMGRVGRIDVQITSKKGETRGEVLIASSLDRAETAILAASLETIDRIGPCAAHVLVGSIEDIRVTKRRKILERAKELLIDHFEDGTVDTESILEQVRESLRVEKISAVGDDRLPAGPNATDSDAIIVVEGRADVINLLRYGIKNAIAVEGTHIPKDIIELAEKKTVTAFFDGDRGGELILRELLQVSDVDFVAYSPRDKSVEDLSRKEIIKALRNKIPAEYVRDTYFLESGEGGQHEVEPERVIAPPALPLPPEPVHEPVRQKEPSGKVPEEAEKVKKPAGGKVRKEAPQPPAPSPPQVQQPLTLKDQVMEVRNRKTARLVTRDFGFLREFSAEQTEDALNKAEPEASGLVTDGEVNQRLLDLAVVKGLDFIAAREFRGIIKRPINIRLIKTG
jgi:DNA primase